MHFDMKYSGSPGDISAELTCNGEVVAETGGLVDRRAAEKWAQRAARDYKVANTPAATEAHAVHYHGRKTFSI